jgi:hypothetical protein
VVKSYRAKTTKGIGYIEGTVSKLINEAYTASIASKWNVLCLYVLNLLMVGADLILYIRNKRFDRLSEK